MASERALKLLERFRRSKLNAKPRDVKALYLAFGFVIDARARHDIVSHPKYPELFGAIPRHKKLASYVADQAVDLVEQLLLMERSEENRE